MKQILNRLRNILINYLNKPQTDEVNKKFPEFQNLVIENIFSVLKKSSLDGIVHVKGRTNLALGSCYDKSISNLFYYDVYVPDLNLFVIAGKPEAISDFDIAKSYGISWEDWEKAQRFKYLTEVIESKGFKVVTIDYLSSPNYDSIVGAAL